MRYLIVILRGCRHVSGRDFHDQVVKAKSYDQLITDQLFIGSGSRVTRATGRHSCVRACVLAVFKQELAMQVPTCTVFMYTTGYTFFLLP